MKNLFLFLFLLVVFTSKAQDNRVSEMCIRDRYSNLKTTGVYIYAEDIRVKSRKAVVHAESEIKNEYILDKKVTYKVEVSDRDGKSIKSFQGTQTVVKPGETATLEASAEIDGLHFWSWGYGYLYTVKTSLWVDGRKVDDCLLYTSRCV